MPADLPVGEATNLFPNCEPVLLAPGSDLWAGVGNKYRGRDNDRPHAMWGNELEATRKLINI